MRQGLKTRNVLPKRVSERILEQGGFIEVPETASQDRRLQRTVVQYLDISVEVDKNVFQERQTQSGIFAVWLSVVEVLDDSPPF